MTSWRIIEGDCVEAMAAMDECSVDAVVCDPPYGIGFMGHEWDQPGVEHRAGPGKWDQPPAPGRTAPRSAGSMEAGKYDLRPPALRQFQQWCEQWAVEALRVLKPGGHLLVFGGTRTYHRLTCAVEDAGFEIRDCLVWLYGSGFPKSLDVSKAIDKAAGAEREVVGVKPSHRPNVVGHDPGGSMGGGAITDRLETAPATPEAEQWSGWGTALKPAHEPIVLARKPLAGTVAATVLEHGTGALNVGATKIGFASEADERESKEKNRHADFGSGPRENEVYNHDGRSRADSGNYDPPGRWPANVVLDEEAAGMLDEQTGDRPSGGGDKNTSNRANGTTIGHGLGAGSGDGVGADSGGASRFFYTAKASRSERNAGLEAFEKRPVNWSNGEQSPGTFQSEGTDKSARNSHPTVKPIALMRWLCRLVTPPCGLVLDPFTGSGTTGCAAAIEGFEFVGIEREPEYAAIARARITYWGDPKAHDARLAELAEVERRAEAEARGEPVQLALDGEAA